MKPSLSTDDLLAHISLDDLKAVFRNVLADADAGAIARRELLGHADKALAYARAQAEEECKSIIKEASICFNEAVEGAMGMKGMATSDDIPNAVFHCLPRARALLERGHLVHGPELAWKAVLGVCRFATYEWDGGEARFQEGEENCDKFHESVDVLLLDICRAQKNLGNKAWLGPDRMKNIRKLQRLPQEPCTYRYPKTRAFLEHEATESADQVSENT